ncbi:MAG: hypothetical protein ACYTAO_04245 [Planctomycetota bacterium]|jgi:hypothetical protein
MAVPKGVTKTGRRLISKTIKAVKARAKNSQSVIKRGGKGG